MKEEWKPIKGYEGIYDISNYGQLYSHPRTTTKGGYTFGTNNTYLEFILSKNGKKEKKRLHILVYETFIGDIPKGYDVHHKDHNKHNNYVGNLELIEKRKHCIRHNKDRADAAKKSLSKTVLQYTINMELVAEYPSTIEAARKTGFQQRNISKACNGKIKIYKGFIWKYKNISDSLAA